MRFCKIVQCSIRRLFGVLLEVIYGYVNGLYKVCEKVV